MSALLVPGPEWHEAPPTTDPEPRTPLRAVPRALPRLARMPFILVLIGIFGLGMTGLLMLNTTLQNQAFQASTLNRQATELAYTQADLEAQIDVLAAPQELARRASALGLRPNPYPAFLVLPQGKIVGKPKAVVGNEAPFMVIKTPAEIAAEKAAAVARQQALAVQRAAKARADAIAAQAKAAQQKIDDAARAAKAKQTAAAKKVTEAQQAAAAKKAAVAKKAAETKKAAVQKAAAKKAATKKTNGARG